MKFFPTTLAAIPGAFLFCQEQLVTDGTPFHTAEHIKPILQEGRIDGKKDNGGRRRHLRRYPPPGLVQGDLDRVLDSLEAPWGRRIERQFREILDDEDEEPITVSRRIVDKIRELGMQPFVAPEPLPLIDEDEIMLICWMATDAPHGDAAQQDPRIG